MTHVYIVLGQCGEYSDRDVWVCGVYVTEAEAQAAIVERMAVSRVYSAWLERRADARKSLLRENLPGLDYEERLERAAGPSPEVEEAEYCALVSCPVGQWGKWDQFDSWVGPKDVLPEPLKEGE